MRISAAILVVLGSVLTLTIVWAAVGFLMMGFGLICGLIAERRERRGAPSTKRRPARRGQAKTSRAAVGASAPAAHHREPSLIQLFDPGYDEQFASRHALSPKHSVAEAYATDDLESSPPFEGDQNFAAEVEPRAEYVDRGHRLHAAANDGSLFPGMMSLVVEAVENDQSLAATEPTGAHAQAYAFDDVRHEWPEAVDEAYHSLRDDAPPLPRDEGRRGHPSYVVSSGNPALSETDKESIEEAEQLIKLLNKMNEKRPTDL